MEVIEGKPEQIRFGIFAGKEYRGLLTEFPNEQIVASIVVTDQGTREHKCVITSSRDEALVLILAWWTELENSHIE